MIKGIHHFSMIVSSEQSVRFYEGLGFKEVFRKERPYDTVVLMEGFGTGLELFIDPIHPKRAEKPEALGLRYLSLQVENLETCIQKYECGPIREDWKGIRYTMTKDPDGLPVQFHE